MRSDKERLRALGLHEFFFNVKGAGWVDESGFLSSSRIRQRYMLAGLIPPASDNAEDLFASIEANTKLLNNYLTHSGELKDYVPEPIVVKKIPKKPKKPEVLVKMKQEHKNSSGNGSKNDKV